MVSPARFVPFFSLLALLGGSCLLPLAAQAPGLPADPQPQLVATTGSQYMGVWDGATGHRLDDGNSAALAGAAPVLVYDNSNFQGSAISFGRIVILFDYGILTANGANSITRIQVAYGSFLQSTHVTLRLHRGLNAGEVPLPAQQPGVGISIPLYDLPGDDHAVDVNGDPILTARFVDVLLPYPIPLDDGAIRYGLQFFDEETLVVQVKANPNLSINKKLQGYKATDGSFFTGGGLPYNGSQPSIYIQLSGQVPAFDPTSGMDRDLGVHSSHSGIIAPVGDVDVFRYEALAGEQLNVAVSGKGKQGLRPLLQVTDLSTGELLGSDGDGTSTRARLKKLPLPSSGAYEVRVSGVGESSGAFKLRFAAKASPLAKQVTVPEAPGSVLAAFSVKQGTLLTALVKPAQKTDAPVPLPELVGPLGSIDLAPWATLKGANTWRIRKAPLPVFGNYELRQASTEGTVALLAKARLKPARLKGGRSSELANSLAGAWIQREFVTPVSSFRSFLELGKGGNSRRERVENTGGVTSKTTTALTSWKVSLAGIAELPDAFNFAFQLAPTAQLIKPFSPGGLNSPQTVSSGPVKSFKDVFVFKGGNPDVIEFPFEATEEKVWYREVSSSLEPPQVTRQLTTDVAGGSPWVALSIGCQSGVDHFEIFKTTAGDSVPPSFALTRIAADCEGAGVAGTVWVDSGSSGDPGGFDYWVAAVGPDGRRSSLRGPIAAN